MDLLVSFTQPLQIGEVSDHREKFELKCLRGKGMAFQSFFEDIMALDDASFQPVKSQGRWGDFKCDGWHPKTRTVFQCYAPETLKAKEVLEKILEDGGFKFQVEPRLRESVSKERRG